MASVTVSSPATTVARSEQTGANAETRNSARPSPLSIGKPSRLVRESGRLVSQRRQTDVTVVFDPANDRILESGASSVRWQTAQMVSPSKKEPGPGGQSKRRSCRDDPHRRRAKIGEPPTSTRTIPNRFHIRFCQAHWHPLGAGLIIGGPCSRLSCSDLPAGGRSIFLIGVPVTSPLAVPRRTCMAGKAG